MGDFIRSRRYPFLKTPIQCGWDLIEGFIAFRHLPVYDPIPHPTTVIEKNLTPDTDHTIQFHNDEV